MSIRVKIDHRECKLKELINIDRITCPVDYENLEHGDIIVYYVDIPIYVFERKTIPDLTASIYDGRYRNQKLKMLDVYDRGQIYYILEGDSHFQEDALKGAVINTMLRDKIGVFRTKDIHDTLNLLYDIVDRVQKDPHKYIMPCNKQLQPNSKNRNESTFVNMLCQIPQISVKTAHAIQAKYTCFDDLRALFDNKTYVERINSLGDIMIVASGGKSRKISCVACQNIVNGYYGEP